MAEQVSPQSVVEMATGILVARKGCSPDVALIDLITAAHGNELTVDELAECLVAHQAFASGR